MEKDIENTTTKKIDIPNISQNQNSVILKHREWYQKLMKLPSGMNVYQTSKLLKIPYSSLDEFLRELEFCKLISLSHRIENGRAVKIIEIPKEEGENEKEN